MRIQLCCSIADGPSVKSIPLRQDPRSFRAPSHAISSLLPSYIYIQHHIFNTVQPVQAFLSFSVFSFLVCTLIPHDPFHHSGSFDFRHGFLQDAILDLYSRANFHPMCPYNPYYVTITIHTIAHLLIYVLLLKQNVLQRPCFTYLSFCLHHLSRT